jgi:hypothetical protein
MKEKCAQYYYIGRDSIKVGGQGDWKMAREGLAKRM